MWVLVSLARYTKDTLLLSEIERIAKFPTRDEIEEEQPRLIQMDISFIT